jgi:hypothetical protein
MRVEEFEKLTKKQLRSKANVCFATAEPSGELVRTALLIDRVVVRLQIASEPVGNGVPFRLRWICHGKNGGQREHFVIVVPIWTFRNAKERR